MSSKIIKPVKPFKSMPLVILASKFSDPLKKLSVSPIGLEKANDSTFKGYKCPLSDWVASLVPTYFSEKVSETQSSMVTLSHTSCPLPNLKYSPAPTISALSHQSQWQNLVREEFGSILKPSSRLTTSPNFPIFWLCHHCAWVGSFGVPVGWPNHSWWVSNVPPQFLLNCRGVSALIQLYQIIGPHIQVGLQLEKPLILRINDPRWQKLMPLT